MTKKTSKHAKKKAAIDPMNKAKFIPYLVRMIGTPPYRFEGLTNFSLFLKADKAVSAAESTLVDKYLNEPLGCSGNDCVYQTANTNPLLIFSEVQKSFSIPDDNKQTISYQEVSIIVPVIVSDRKTAGFFIPILFVDGPPGAKENWQGAIPIVIGREMYGLPKVRATIEFEYDGQEISKGTVSMYGETLITITGKSSHPDEHTNRYTDKQRHSFVEQIFGEITPNADFTSGTTKEGHAVDLTHAGHGNPLIGLRQMRDPHDLAYVDHQDVVESAYVVDPPTMPHPLGNALTVEFNLKSGLFDGLHLQEKYELPYPTDGAVYSNVAAIFGDPESTKVRHRPD